jgi:hypothetical protein
MLHDGVTARKRAEAPSQNRPATRISIPFMPFFSSAMDVKGETLPLLHNGRGLQIG